MTTAPRPRVVLLRAALVLVVLAASVASVPAAEAAPHPPGPPPPGPNAGQVSGRAPDPVSHPGEDGGHAGGKGRRGTKPNLADSMPRGMDVSGYQGAVDWAGARSSGALFAYVKATEGTTYQNPQYRQQYEGSAGAGLIRGAYHFALPDRTAAPAQATFFVDHGGGWSPDGRTLPPMIDIEDNPYGDQCYGLSSGAMTAWLQSFSDVVKQRTGRSPPIYTSTRWWKACTGDSAAFGANPLFLARYAEDPGPMPASWAKETIWQYDDGGTFPGDQDVVRGTLADLQALTRM